MGAGLRLLFINHPGNDDRHAILHTNARLGVGFFDHWDARVPCGACRLGIIPAQHGTDFGPDVTGNEPEFVDPRRNPQRHPDIHELVGFPDHIRASGLILQLRVRLGRDRLDRGLLAIQGRDVGILQ